MRWNHSELCTHNVLLNVFERDIAVTWIGYSNLQLLGQPNRCLNCQSSRWNTKIMKRSKANTLESGVYQQFNIAVQRWWHIYTNLHTSSPIFTQTLQFLLGAHTFPWCRQNPVQGLAGNSPTIWSCNTTRRSWPDVCWETAQTSCSEGREETVDRQPVRRCSLRQLWLHPCSDSGVECQSLWESEVSWSTSWPSTSRTLRDICRWVWCSRVRSGNQNVKNFVCFVRNESRNPSKNRYLSSNGRIVHVDHVVFWPFSSLVGMPLGKVFAECQTEFHVVAASSPLWIYRGWLQGLLRTLALWTLTGAASLGHGLGQTGSSQTVYERLFFGALKWN